MKNNPVAKNCKKFNKAVVHIDRKKALKRGAVKHKTKAGHVPVSPPLGYRKINEINC